MTENTMTPVRASWDAHGSPRRFTYFGAGVTARFVGVSAVAAVMNGTLVIKRVDNGEVMSGLDPAAEFWAAVESGEDPNATLAEVRELAAKLTGYPVSARARYALAVRELTALAAEVDRSPGRDTFALPPSGGLVVRVIGYPNDGGRFEVYALAEHSMICAWSATFDGETPPAVLVAALSAAYGVWGR